MTIKDYEAMLEAVLFACGDSVELTRLCDATGLEMDIVRSALKSLEDSYVQNNRGIRLVWLNSRVQLVSAPEYHEAVKKAANLRPKAGLSPSALEVLSIVAYNQPVTKFAIEKLRGADSSYPISRLTQAGLIGEAGRLNVPGRPILYATTEEFLRCFSIASLEELPDLANRQPADHENE